MRSQVRVFDKDEIKDDSLGFVDVPLGEDDFSGGGSCSQLFRNVAYILHVAFLLCSHATLRNDKCDTGTILRELTLHGVKHGSIKLSITYEKLD